MPRAVSVLLAAALIPAFSSALRSQQPVPRDSTRAPRDSIPTRAVRDRLTFDVTATASGIAGGARNRLLGGLDLSMGIRVGRFASGSLLLIATGGTYWSRATSSACRPGSGIECLPLRSTNSAYSLLLGWEPWRGGRQDWRVLAGPTFFEAGPGAQSAGFRTRLDFAPPTARLFGFVASAGTAVLYDFEGSTAVTGTVGLGFRIR